MYGSDDTSIYNLLKNGELSHWAQIVQWLEQGLLAVFAFWSIRFQNKTLLQGL